MAETIKTLETIEFQKDGHLAGCDRDLSEFNTMVPLETPNVGLNFKMNKNFDMMYFQKRQIKFCTTGNHVVKAEYHKTGTSYSGGKYWRCPVHKTMTAGILNLELDVPASAKWDVPKPTAEEMMRE